MLIERTGGRATRVALEDCRFFGALPCGANEAQWERMAALVRQEIEARLQFEPEVETRNRKPLKRAVAFEAEWEIRFGPNNRFRVFYEVDPEVATVFILAIGVKVRERLYIGGEELAL